MLGQNGEALAHGLRVAVQGPGQEHFFAAKARLVEASDFKGDENFAKLPAPEEMRDSDQAMLGQPMVGSPAEIAETLADKIMAEKIL